MTFNDLFIIRNDFGKQTVRRLNGSGRNFTNRVSAKRRSVFQNILAAFQAGNFDNDCKIRGLTIADYRARAVATATRCRLQSEPTAGKSDDTAKSAFAEEEAAASIEKDPLKKDSPQRRDLKAFEFMHEPDNTARRQRAILTDHQLIAHNVRKASAKYNLPPELINSVIQAESNFKVRAVSSAGARGLMQLMPATAKELGVEDSFDIVQNIDGGARYLRKMLDRFGGNIRKALAAYNAGPGTVIKYNGRVPYPETRQYVKRVLRLSRQMV